MYKAIHFFTDLQDFNHPYNVGDIFPRDGLKVSKERLIELSGSNNKQGKPLIKNETEIRVEINGKEVAKAIKNLNGYTKTDINRMSTAELKNLAIEVGIENAYEIIGADLKKILIEKFGL